MMDQIVRQYLNGASIIDLARKNGIAYSTLYSRLIKFGKPKKPSQAERDMARFECLSMPEPNSGCWLWLGQADHYGYGKMWFNGRKQTAQRVAWMLFRGPIPTKWEIDHLCYNPSCVNPNHLRAVTKAENLAGRKPSKKEYCRKGHPFSDDNILLESAGKVRRCKICRRTSRQEAAMRALKELT